MTFVRVGDTNQGVTERKMADLAPRQRVEAAFLGCSDPVFRARCVSEYSRMRGWIGDRIDWEKCRILDFGCGEGHAATSIALRHPASNVVGVDIMAVSPDDLARKLDAQTGLSMPVNLHFAEVVDGALPELEEFDAILAWSVLEHVRQDWLSDTVRSLADRLRRGGFLFVYCDPLYFSPRGALLHRYKIDSWQHLMFSLDALRSSVLSHGNPTAVREWQQFMELNRMTAGDLLLAGEEAGLVVVRQQRFVVDLPLPTQLLQTYNPEVLSTSAIQVLFSKP